MKWTAEQMVFIFIGIVEVVGADVQSVVGGDVVDYLAAFGEAEVAAIDHLAGGPFEVVRLIEEVSTEVLGKRKMVDDDSIAVDGVWYHPIYSTFFARTIGSTRGS